MSVFGLFVIAGLLVGLCLGGKLTRLGDIQIPRFWFLMASFILSILPAYSRLGIFGTHKYLAFGVSLLSYGLLFYSLYPSLRLLGFKSIWLGSFLNLLVEAVNQGRMPVRLDGLSPERLPAETAKLASSLTHQVLGPDTKMAFLADNYRFNLPGFKPSVASVGDFVLGLGVAVFIIAVMLRGFPVPEVDANIS